MNEEGWYSDPYGVHEHRWFSAATPTSLVRDHGKTSHDAPPTTAYVEKPHLIESAASLAKDDLRRGDDDGSNGVDPVDAAWTIFTRSSGL
jgi:hypothetical protein